MLPTMKPPRLAPTLLLLTMLCAGCASAPPPLAVPVQRLPLPAEARQPETDPICVPTCAAGWRRLLESLLPEVSDSPRLPTTAASPAAPASASATGR